MARYLFMTFFDINGRLSPLSTSIYTTKPRPYKKVSPIIEAISVYKFAGATLTEGEIWEYENGRLKDTLKAHTDPPQSASAQE